MVLERFCKGKADPLNLCTLRYSVHAGNCLLAPSAILTKLIDRKTFSCCERVVAMSAVHRSDDTNAVLGPWVPPHRLGDPICNWVKYQKLLWPKTPSALPRRDKHPLASQHVSGTQARAVLLQVPCFGRPRGDNQGLDAC